MKINIPVCCITISMQLLMWNPTPAHTQGVLPVNRYKVYSLLMLDKISIASSFAYSLRKIRRGYTGYAVRVRIGSGISTAEADVSFDADGVVSANSTATVTSAGLLSGFSAGQVLSFSSFKGTKQAYVKTWYDQGVTAYHATQNTSSLQPELVLNSAGASNNKPSILFTGAEYLDVGQSIEKLVNNGINGSFLLWTKPTANAEQLSFGYIQPSSSFRWSLHFNWSNSRLYFDAGEICCATLAFRSVDNAANINIFKQYSFIRGTSYKTVRINSAATSLNNTSSSPTAANGGGFYIGWAFNGTAAKYKGNVCEVLMFPSDLSNNDVLLPETDQINFWSN